MPAPASTLGFLQFNVGHGEERLQQAMAAWTSSTLQQDIMLLQEARTLPEWSAQGWSAVYCRPRDWSHLTPSRQLHRYLEWRDAAILVRPGLRCSTSAEVDAASTAAATVTTPHGLLLVSNTYLAPALSTEAVDAILSSNRTAINCTSATHVILGGDLNARGGIWDSGTVNYNLPSTLVESLLEAADLRSKHLSVSGRSNATRTTLPLPST